MADRSFIKLYCPIKNAYAFLTVDKGKITNFQSIKEEDAKEIQNASSVLPPISENLLSDALTGTRTPNSVDKKSRCVFDKGVMTYQCLFCNAFQVPASGGPYDVYFLMDESGSMSMIDRTQGVNAIKNIIISLTGMGNHYNFVPWGTEAGYIFKDETDGTRINNGLELYRLGRTGYRGRTCADTPFILIKDQVMSSPRESIIIFVTDGGFEAPKKAFDAHAALLRARPTAKVFAIGIAEAKKENIDPLNTDGEWNPEIFKDSSALTRAFEDIAELLKKRGGNL